MKFVELKNKLGRRYMGLSVYQIIVLVVLIAMLFFFSDSSLLRRMKFSGEIKGLRSQIEYYRNQTEIDRAKLEELQSSLDNLEKYARENYLMKKRDEEVFVIE